MFKRNLADKAPAAAAPTPKTDEEADEGLPGLQRLWDDMFGAILKLCQDAASADNTRLAPAVGQVTVERTEQVAA